MSTKIQTFVPFLLASFSSVTLHRTTYRTTSISFDMPWNRSIFSGHIIGTAYAVPIIKLRLAAQAFYREFLTELPIRYITGTPSQPHKSVNKKARCVNRTSSHKWIHYLILSATSLPSASLVTRMTRSSTSHLVDITKSAFG